MTHYILVKVEADDVDAVILTLDAALDGDDIHKSIGRALVCDIRNCDVLEVLDAADLQPSRTETRGA